MSGNRSPGLREVIEGHVADGLRTLRVAQPGRVQAYDPTGLTVDVLPLLRSPVEQDDGSIVWMSQPVINAVPLVMPQAGGRLVRLPVAPGDVVLLVFCDWNLDAWKGGAGATDPHGLGVVDPLVLDGHAVADAIAIPGLLNPIGAPPVTAIEIQADGSVVLAGGTHKVARAGDSVDPGNPLTPATMAQWMAAVTTAINSLVPSSVPPAPTSVGTIAGGADMVKA
jgi:hypothetical protein